mmetsp:Transcript_5205/g.15076  ORF Transcript_5205/g.15076 Transcript_5205/m.15076 type:complete len:366 (-) Transcript_5205:65-1162(-)
MRVFYRYAQRRDGPGVRLVEVRARASQRLDDSDVAVLRGAEHGRASEVAHRVGIGARPKQPRHGLGVPLERRADDRRHRGLVGRRPGRGRAVLSEQAVDGRDVAVRGGVGDAARLDGRARVVEQASNVARLLDEGQRAHAVTLDLDAEQLHVVARRLVPVAIQRAAMRAAPPRDAADVADDASAVVRLRAPPAGRAHPVRAREVLLAGAEAEHFVLLLERSVSVTTGHHIPEETGDPTREGREARITLRASVGIREHGCRRRSARGAHPLIVCVFGGHDAALAAARLFSHPASRRSRCGAYCLWVRLRGLMASRASSRPCGISCALLYRLGRARTRAGVAALGCSSNEGDMSSLFSNRRVAMRVY